jgi:hypothetical protein
LAGLFARKLHERYPTLRLLGFRAPFDLKLVYEVLRHEAFDGSEEPALLPRLQAEADVHEHMRLMLTSLARRQRPCAFVLDNLEALQDIRILRLAPAHEDSLRLLRTVCTLPAPTRVLLTGRYAMQELADGVITPYWCTGRSSKCCHQGMSRALREGKFLRAYVSMPVASDTDGPTPMVRDSR